MILPQEKKQVYRIPILKFWKSVIWAIIIAILLFLPGDKIPETELLKIPHIDKIVHFFLFIFLEILLLIDLNSPLSLKNKLIITCIALVYASSTEVLQYFFTTSRKGDWFDLIFDSAGITVGWIIYQVRKRS